MRTSGSSPCCLAIAAPPLSNGTSIVERNLVPKTPSLTALQPTISSSA
jgi:hypothetical protein